MKSNAITFIVFVALAWGITSLLGTRPQESEAAGLVSLEVPISGYCRVELSIPTPLPPGTTISNLRSSCDCTIPGGAVTVSEARTAAIHAEIKLDNADFSEPIPIWRESSNREAYGSAPENPLVNVSLIPTPTRSIEAVHIRRRSAASSTGESIDSYYAKLGPGWALDRSDLTQVVIEVEGHSSRLRSESIACELDEIGNVVSFQVDVRLPSGVVGDAVLWLSPGDSEMEIGAAFEVVGSP